VNSHSIKEEVRYSDISSSPDSLLPENSCDCHHHIYDHRFPCAPDDTRNLPDATLDDYSHLKRRLGFQRHVLVQPSSYGTDNRCLLAALAQAGDCARGEAVVTDRVSDSELDALGQAGVTGVRFNFGAGSATTPEMMLPLAHRLAARGWHLQIHASADQLWSLRERLLQLPGNLVIDHVFRLPQPEPMAHPAWRLAWELINQGRCWVKLSGLYHQSRRDDVSDMSALVKSFLHEATERVLWGSDWPHPSLISANKKMPDDALILSKIFHWASNEQVRHKLFVANPAELYRFN
jgi:D-galactarolactone isomerase